MSSLKSQPENPGLAATDLPEPTTATPEARKPGRFVFVDALRGVAAMWVVLFHAYEGKHMDQLSARMPGWSLAILERGSYGVPIFFVLSGFVIAHSVSRQVVDGRFIGRFAIRRSIRLDPPYWASMVLVVGFGLLSAAVVSNKTYEAPGVARVVAHLFYVQDILGYPAINPIYWTLALEIQFYLVFCLLMGVAHATRCGPDDRRSLFAVFVPALLIAAAWPLGLLRGNLWPGLFPPLWHGFLLGMLACWGMNRTVRPAWFYTYAAIVGAGAAWTGSPFAGVCVATSTILMIAAQVGGLERWLGWSWLQFLGLISYSLYLIHNPVSGALYNVGYRITGRSPASEAFWFVAMVGTNVTAAFAAWWLIERPSLAMAQRFRQRPR